MIAEESLHLPIANVAPRPAVQIHPVVAVWNGRTGEAFQLGNLLLGHALTVDEYGAGLGVRKHSEERQAQSSQQHQGALHSQDRACLRG
jgi:hypothetical protein